jgi:nucleoid DNA-binding protein
MPLFMLASGQMKKSDLAREVAKRKGLETADAADQMDRIVNQIIRKLKGGRPARLPGLGTITPGKHWTFQQERNED